MTGCFFRRRRQLCGARWVITGASRGIGKALAIQAARSGVRLLLVARSAPALEELSLRLNDSPQVHLLPGDVTSSECRCRIAEWVQSEWDGCDVLINNAGLGSFGPLAAAPESRIRTVMEVNFFAPILLTKSLLPWLRKGQDPLIVNVGSVLAYCAVPWKGEYCAAKAALRAASDAWRAELTAGDIQVLFVSPSTVDTTFFDHLANGSLRAPKRRGVPPDVVARRTLQAIATFKSEVVLTWEAHAMIWLSRLVPGLLRHALALYARRSLGSLTQEDP